MKYIKHMTLKEWQKFKTPVKPKMNFGKFKSYDNLDKRHEMLKEVDIFCTDSDCSTTDKSRGKIICDNCQKYDEVNVKYPPQRYLQNYTQSVGLTMQEVLLSRYNVILDGYETKWKRRHTAIKKVVNQKNLDKGLSEINKIVGAFSSGMGGTSTKSSHKSKKDVNILMGSKPKTKPVKFFSDPKPPKRGKGKHKPKSNIDILMGSKPKGRKNKSVKFYNDKNNVRVL